jgi:hypothetical protein
VGSSTSATPSRSPGRVRFPSPYRGRTSSTSSVGSRGTSTIRSSSLGQGSGARGTLTPQAPRPLAPGSASSLGSGTRSQPDRSPTGTRGAGRPVVRPSQGHRGATTGATGDGGLQPYGGRRPLGSPGSSPTRATGSGSIGSGATGDRGIRPYAGARPLGSSSSGKGSTGAGVIRPQDARPQGSGIGSGGTRGALEPYGGRRPLNPSTGTRSPTGGDSVGSSGARGATGDGGLRPQGGRRPVGTTAPDTGASPGQDLKPYGGRRPLGPSAGATGDGGVQPYGGRRPLSPSTGGANAGGASGDGAVRPYGGARPKGPSGGSGVKATGLPGKVEGGKGSGLVGSADSVRGIRDLAKTNPTRARSIEYAGQALGYAQQAAIGAGVKAAGGVFATPYLGTYGSTYGYGHGYGYGYGYNHYTGYGYHHVPSYCYSPWGFGISYSSGYLAFSYGYGSHWWNPCYSWYWPTYVASWYPTWYTYYRPYAPYRSTSTVYETIVYETVYADEEEEEEEPVAQTPVLQQEPQPVQQQSQATSIAAERYLVLGDRAFREGRYTDAVQLYAKAVEFSPGEGALYLVLADALFAAGDYHYGAYAIRRALELDARLVDVPVDKHQFYDDPQKFDHQLAVLEQYVIDHPTDRDARLVLALNNLFGGRPAAAVDVLEAREAAPLAGDVAAEAILASALKLQYGASTLGTGSEDED